MFRDRSDAGKKLSPLLLHYKNHPNAIVIGLPRGGVVTAFEVAKALNLPLDVICPRKVGAPMNPELALGAVTHTGEGFFNEYILRSMNVPQNWLKSQIEKEKELSLKRQALYRKGRPPLNVKGKTVLLVDDGLATGATMKASINWAKKENAQKIVVAVPVAPIETFEEIRSMVDEAISCSTPLFFQAVGQFYEDFGQTSDEEVIQLLS